jgi:phosphoenolpyruvate---glycerone phosphotransferase subunit DhaL
MIDKNNLIIFFDLLCQKAKFYYQDFNEIDGKLGDGDLGITILKGLEEIMKNKDHFEDDIGKIFLLCAKLFSKVSSSSFGTLTAISFMTLSKEYKDKKKINDEDIIIGLKKIIEAISVRGKSNIGDKTILDSLSFIIKHLETSKNKNLGLVAHEACNKSLIEFKNKECKIGRARMFSEKSKDLDDPGMFAFSKLSSLFVENKQ